MVTGGFSWVTCLQRRPLPAAMSLEWLPSSSCASWHHSSPTRTWKVGASDGFRESVGGGGGEGTRIQLRGLDTEQLKGSLMVLYTPAGNSCLLKLVRRA